jgi:hypothetical protein
MLASPPANGDMTTFVLSFGHVDRFCTQYSTTHFEYRFCTQCTATLSLSSAMQSARCRGGDGSRTSQVWRPAMSPRDSRCDPATPAVRRHGVWAAAGGNAGRGEDASICSHTHRRRRRLQFAARHRAHRRRRTSDVEQVARRLRGARSVVAGVFGVPGDGPARSRRGQRVWTLAVFRWEFET